MGCIATPPNNVTRFDNRGVLPHLGKGFICGLLLGARSFVELLAFCASSKNPTVTSEILPLDGIPDKGTDGGLDSVYDGILRLPLLCCREDNNSVRKMTSYPDPRGGICPPPGSKLHPTSNAATPRAYMVLLTTHAGRFDLVVTLKQQQHCGGGCLGGKKLRLFLTLLQRVSTVLLP